MERDLFVLVGVPVITLLFIAFRKANPERFRASRPWILVTLTGIVALCALYLLTLLAWP